MTSRPNIQQCLHEWFCLPPDMKTWPKDVLIHKLHMVLFFIPFKFDQDGRLRVELNRAIITFHRLMTLVAFCFTIFLFVRLGQAVQWEASQWIPSLGTHLVIGTSTLVGTINSIQWSIRYPHLTAIIFNDAWQNLHGPGLEFMMMLKIIFKGPLYIFLT